MGLRAGRSRTRPGDERRGWRRKPWTVLLPQVLPPLPSDPFPRARGMEPARPLGQLKVTRDRGAPVCGLRSWPCAWRGAAPGSPLLFPDLAWLWAGSCAVGVSLLSAPGLHPPQGPERECCRLLVAPLEGSR